MVFLKKLFRWLCSLKLAVLVIVALTAALAAGTIYESLYDTRTANYFVYRAFWFRALLNFLGLIIFLVALSRWPWKKKHVPFLLAHLGILILLFGSWLTQTIGVDANMMVDEGQVSSSAVGQDTMLILKTSGGKPKPFPIRWVPPMVSWEPITIEEERIEISEFITHAEAVYRFEPAPDGTTSMSPAVQVELYAPRMGFRRKVWVWYGDFSWRSSRLGPAEIVLKRDPDEKNYSPDRSPTRLELIFNENGKLRYEAHSRSGKKTAGRVDLEKLSKEPQKLPLSWGKAMGGVEVRLVAWVPNAINASYFAPSRTQYGPQAPPSAIRLKDLATGSTVWMGENENFLLQRKQGTLSVVYLAKRKFLPFGVRLDRFRIDYDLGTRNPASYSSMVRVVENGQPLSPFLIEMNEPLKHGKYTFYQSSYIPKEPRPTTSVLSVNYDPGRWWKYIGSFLIVLGSSLLFIVKYRQSKARRKGDA